MSKTLVTGASGFVGKATCRVLTSRGAPIVPAVRVRKESGQFEVGDLNGRTDWTEALRDCDTIIHLAARVHVMQDKASDPVLAYRETNVEATVNLAKQAIQQGVRRFVFVSSVKVNGEGTSGKPFTAFDEPAPVDAYGQSKLEAEVALKELAAASNMELVIIRPPLVYGPGVKANFLRLMQLVRLGLPLPFRNISNRRSMIALDNLVDLIVLCTSHPRAAGHVFMASDDNDLSITSLVTMIAKSMGKRPILLPVPIHLIKAFAAALGKAAVADRLLGSLQVNITHTRETLNWRPLVTPEAAIEKTVMHFLHKN